MRRCPSRAGAAAGRHLARTLLLLALLLLGGCAPTVHVTRKGGIDPTLAHLSAEAVRDHFTRAVVPPDLEVRWVEATLVDPAWIVAEDREWGTRVGADPEQVARLTQQRMVRQDVDQGIHFEIWAFVQCPGCEDLKRWHWTLTGSAPDAAARTPLQATSTVMDTEQQTLTLLEVARPVTVSKVRGELTFSGTIGAGTLVLEGTPAPGFEPLRFVWKIGE